MRKKKILLVEDDPDTREIVAVILEDQDLELLKLKEVPAVTDIAEAEPDLILLDEWLPGKNGSEFCLELKSKKDTDHIPVILMSAVCDLETIAQKCRADGFINKPFDIDELKQAVNSCLAVA